MVHAVDMKAILERASLGKYHTLFQEQEVESIIGLASGRSGLPLPPTSGGLLLVCDAVWAGPGGAWHL